jgi:hypothetical protein
MWNPAEELASQLVRSVAVWESASALDFRQEWVLDLESEWDLQSTLKT